MSPYGIPEVSESGPKTGQQPAQGKTTTTRRFKAFLLIGWALIQIPLTIWLVAPGPLLPDEGINLWMAKSFSERASLDLWNGYEEIASPELLHPFLKVHDHKLFPPYPYLFPVLVFPLYRALGFLGLFLMNSFSFIGLVVLVFLTARRLFRDVDLALNSCLVLCLATYAWEYSQAAWPHATGLFFVMGTFFLFVCSYQAENTRTARLWALATGLLAGLAPAVRMDAFLLFPMLVLPFLFARPWRPIEALLVGAGCIPGLAALTATNYRKFGALTPLAYGNEAYEPVPPLEIIMIASAVILGTWIATRGRGKDILSRHWTKGFVAALLAALVSVFVFPHAWSLVEDIATNAYTLLVDIRSLDMGTIVAQRSSGGGVIYLAAHKKALLQSLPFLPILIVPMVSIFHREEDYPALLLLFLVPVIYMGYYSAEFSRLDSGGGLCLNHRYLLTCLPFMAILAAHGIRYVRQQWGWWPDTRALMAGGFMAALSYVALTLRPGLTIDDLEFPLLGVPLYMAAVLAACLVAGEFSRLRHSPALRTVAWSFLAAAMVWSGLVALGYDFPHHRYGRVAHYQYGKNIANAIPPDSLVFADNKTYAATMSVIDKHRVRLAFPLMDSYEGFRDLIDFNLNKGRRVFAFFHESLWIDLTAGKLRGYVVTPVVTFPGSRLGEISFIKPEKN